MLGEILYCVLAVMAIAGGYLMAARDNVIIWPIILGALLGVGLIILIAIIWRGSNNDAEVDARYLWRLTISMYLKKGVVILSCFMFITAIMTHPYHPHANIHSFDNNSLFYTTLIMVLSISTDLLTTHSLLSKYRIAYKELHPPVEN